MNLKQFAKNKMHRGQNYKPAFEKFMLNRISFKHNFSKHTRCGFFCCRKTK